MAWKACRAVTSHGAEFDLPFADIVRKIIVLRARPGDLAGFAFPVSIALLLVVSAEMIGAERASAPLCCGPAISCEPISFVARRRRPFQRSVLRFSAARSVSRIFPRRLALNRIRPSAPPYVV